MNEQPVKLPLEGMLVIAVEQAVAAPLCTARLVDAGARVIKIERESGDFARGYDTAAGGISSYFAWLNHGKQSLVLDFKRDEDAALLMRLISKADVLVQNLAPGALSRAGFDSDELRKQFPQLITCDISGYGAGEDVHHLKAYDLLVQAESGLVEISGGPGEPGRIGISVCDIGAGVTAHGGVMEALLLRERTGKNSGVTTSLFDVAAEWMSVPYIHEVHGQGAAGRVGLHHPSIAPYGAYATSEGGKTLISIQNEREWKRLCEMVLGDGSIAVQEQFYTNNNRVKNRMALDELMNAIISDLSSHDFRARLRDADIAFAGLNSVEDLARHPALRERQIEGLSMPAHPVQWNSLRTTSSNNVPKLGEHSDAIRKEFS